MKTRAFTLVELLTVIAIIAVLAGLLLPLTRALKLRSDQAASISNLRQWGVALGNSLAENDGLMPSDGAADNKGGLQLETPDAWYNQLPKYMGIPSLKELKEADPADHSGSLPKAGRKSVWVNPAVPESANDGNFAPPDRFLFCYAVNAYMSGAVVGGATYRNLPVHRVNRPAATVFMTEKADRVPNVAQSYVAAFFGAAVRNEKNLPANNPTNVANFLFCDGHVEGITQERFRAPSAVKNDPPDVSFTFVPFDGALTSKGAH